MSLRYIHYKTQTGTSCEKCNSKAFQLGIEPESSRLLDQYSTTQLQKPLPKNLGTSAVLYIYINEMVMPVKYKGILMIIFGIYTRYESHGYVLGNSSVVKIYTIRPKPGAVAKIYLYIYIYYWIFFLKLCSSV